MRTALASLLGSLLFFAVGCTGAGLPADGCSASGGYSCATAYYDDVLDLTILAPDGTALSFSVSAASASSQMVVDRAPTLGQSALSSVVAGRDCRGGWGEGSRVRWDLRDRVRVSVHLVCGDQVVDTEIDGLL